MYILLCYYDEINITNETGTESLNNTGNAKSSTCFSYIFKYHSAGQA